MPGVNNSPFSFSVKSDIITMGHWYLSKICDMYAIALSSVASGAAKRVLPSGNVTFLTMRSSAWITLLKRTVKNNGRYRFVKIIFPFSFFMEIRMSMHARKENMQLYGLIKYGV